MATPTLVIPNEIRSGSLELCVKCGQVLFSRVTMVYCDGRLTNAAYACGHGGLIGEHLIYRHSCGYETYGPCADAKG